ncbi:hypothetical protein DFQ26_000559 [Actinomortierella ambigua]|nr:hypothetical protein DFQ26_000559 [Actinomortierella ambigua]
MPIAVKTTFSQDGVFFAGEKLYCTITLTNTAPSVSAREHAELASSLSRMAVSGTPNGRQRQSVPNGNGISHGIHMHKSLPYPPLPHQLVHAHSAPTSHAGSPAPPMARTQHPAAAPPPMSSESRIDRPLQQQQQQQQQKPSSQPPQQLQPPHLQPLSPPSSNESSSLQSTSLDLRASSPFSAGSEGSSQPATGFSSGQPSVSSPVSDQQSPDESPNPDTTTTPDQALVSARSTFGPDAKSAMADAENTSDHEGQQQEEKQPAPASAPEDNQSVSGQEDDQVVSVQAPEAPTSPTSPSSSAPSDWTQIQSPGLLGLASYMYRSASFSSLASAFGLSGSEQQLQEGQSVHQSSTPQPVGYPIDEKKLPAPPPQDRGDAESRSSGTVLSTTEIKSPDAEQNQGAQPNSEAAQAAGGGPIGLGLEMQRSESVRTTDSSNLSKVEESNTVLQVSENDRHYHHHHRRQQSSAAASDTQSIADESDLFQTPRPSLDYSTRSSMQSIRGPLPYYPGHGSSLLPQRRSSVMSGYSSYSSLVPGVPTKLEHLLWGSVQIVGQFIVDGSFIRQQGFETLKSKTMYRPTGGAGGGAVGGGTLGAASVGSGSLADWRDRANANRLFPVFSTPPSILFVDLQLAPGESASYTYEIELPAGLPPSHRGKTIRLAYNLVLGVQRGSVHTPAKSVQLPFRLFNNISERGDRPEYDMMSPVVLYKDTAATGVVGQDIDTGSSCKRDINPNLARKQFQDYVDELMRHVKKPENGGVRDGGGHVDQQQQQQLGTSPSRTRELTRRESDAYKDEEAANHAQTCLDRIAVLARSPSSASFDICKNNVPVAKLSLVKTRFKLGENVVGVVSFLDAEIATYQIAVTLETVEAIDAAYSCRSAQQVAKLTKKVHAELHESCIDTKRTSFSLCIPPTATPEFKTSALTLKWYLRVEFITGPPDQPRFKLTSVDERRSQYQAVDILATESFDCSVPIAVYPTSFETGALFPSAMVFTLS